MFKSARIKLTLSYILILMTLSISFSTIVYFNVNTFTTRALENHERRIEERLNDFTRPPRLPERFQKPFTDEAITQIRKNTIVLLAALNIGTFLFAWGFGYWFAGKTLDPIEEMSEKQKKFIADAAHELKTPLTAMKTQLEVNIRNKKRNQVDTDNLLNSLIEDIDSLTLLTNSLLKQSRYSISDIQNKEDVNLNDIAMDVINKFENKLKEKNISLKYTPQELTIKADKKSITELITILVDNAIKFNLENGQINIRIEQRQDLVYINIEDTGIGISPKDLPFVFDRFYKADTSRAKSEHEGFGLGLSIAKEIVNQHNGKIEVESQQNKGTIVTITLPIS